PRLPRFRIASHLLRRKSVERHVIRGMHGHQLSLQMRRKLRNLQSATCHNAANLVAVRLAFCCSLQVKQPRIPRRNLDALVAELRRPRRDTLQIVKRRRIPRKLRQKYRRPLDRPHRSLNPLPQPLLAVRLFSHLPTLIHSPRLDALPTQRLRRETLLYSFSIPKQISSRRTPRPPTNIWIVPNDMLVRCNVTKEILAVDSRHTCPVKIVSSG